VTFELLDATFEDAELRVAGATIARLTVRLRDGRIWFEQPKPEAAPRRRANKEKKTWQRRRKRSARRPSKTRR
jgi:hypothetical protein